MLFDVIGNFLLVVFCDVLWWVFGVCVYIKWNLNDGKFGVWFVVVKFRVVFLKELFIFCLEL